MSIKAIGFDLGGVILGSAYSNSFFDRLTAKLNTSEGSARKAIERFDPEFQRGELTPEQYWTSVAAEVGAEYSEDLLRTPVEHFIEETPVRAEALRLADRLKTNGYPIGLLSNTTAQHVAVNRTRGIFEHFDIALMSNEIGARKPEPAAYQKLLEGLGSKPEETVFIDDLPENIAGAKTVGIVGIQFKGYEQLVERLKQLGVRV